MKTILSILFAGFLYLPAQAQSNKKPVYVPDAPTVFNTEFGSYFNYADQGKASFINNSQFYNKDNHFSNTLPSGNGFYPEPGNSNPVNHDVNSRSLLPPPVIYNGNILIRVTPYSGETSGDFNP